MDRRGFLAGVGTLGAAASGGWATMQVAARGARAEGLAKAAGGTAAGSKAAAGVAATPSLSVGYLPGSAGLLEYAARGWKFPQLATQMRWAQWEPSFALPILDSRVDVGLGMLQQAKVFAPPSLLSLEVVAHFALDKAPHFAPFNAWQYTAARSGKPAKATSPLMFEAAMPDRVGLQVNYAMERTQTLSRLSAGGTVYLPIGGRDGAGTGIYVLATPSRVSGNLPQFSDFAFSGDLNQPLWRFDGGGTPEFDFVTLTIAPVVS
jgi:hypothetical protein